MKKKKTTRTNLAENLTNNIYGSCHGHIRRIKILARARRAVCFMRGLVAYGLSLWVFKKCSLEKGTSNISSLKISGIGQ